jgi:hypothetical protein
MSDLSPHVLGRLDTLMTLAKYQNSQGRMRVMALNLLANEANSFAGYTSTPPVEVPPTLRDAFTMGGRVELVERYCDSTLPRGCRDVLTDEHVKGFLHYNFTVLSESAGARARDILNGYQASGSAQTRQAFQRISAPEAYEFRESDPIEAR